MKTGIKVALLACAVSFFPKLTCAGVLEGALIGGCVGLAVSLAMQKHDTSATSITNKDSSFLADTLRLDSGFTYRFSRDSGASQKIKYAYSGFFSGYDAYTKDKNVVEDTLTPSLISRQLTTLGGIRVPDSSASADIQVRYRQILGWDLGTIVKKMIICAESDRNASLASGPICTEFDERTIFNTHPTQARTTERLVRLLLSNADVPDLDPTKYHRIALKR